MSKFTLVYIDLLLSLIWKIKVNCNAYNVKDEIVEAYYMHWNVLEIFNT